MSRLVATYDRALTDTCQRMIYTAPDANAYGTGTPTYTAGAIIRCQARPAESQELLGLGLGGAQVANVSCVIRFDRDATVTHLDRIQLLTLQGGTVAAGTYEIVAVPVLDQVHYRAALRLVTDGSDA